MTDKHKIYIIILWFSMRIYCKKNEFDIYNSLEVSHLPRFLEFSRMCGLQRALKSLNSTATAACHFALGPVYIRSFSMADEGSYLTHCHTHAHSLAVHRKTSVCPRQMVGRLRLWIEWVFNVGLRKFFTIFFFLFIFYTFWTHRNILAKKNFSLASPILDSENFSPKIFFSFLHVLDPKDHFSNINLISIFFAHFWT